jgi:hypothetical protein
VGSQIVVIAISAYLKSKVTFDLYLSTTDHVHGAVLRNIEIPVFETVQMQQRVVVEQQLYRCVL